MTDWPYDALQDDPLTAMRIPVITTPYPRWYYLAAVLIAEPVEGEREPLWTGLRPTDAEAAMIASFIEEYISYWYNGSWQHKLRTERPFAIDGGANGVVFCKYGEDDWAYRRCSWERGPEFVPVPPRIRAWYEGRGEGGVHTTPMSLPRLMDHVHTICDEPMPRWLEWKAAHPDVFPAAASQAGGAS